MAKKGQWIIPLDKIPENIIVHRYIYQQTDIQKKIDLLGEYSGGDYLELPLAPSLDFEGLLKSTKDGIKRYANYTLGQMSDNPTSYVSSALTWNPDAIDRKTNDPHFTSGSSRMQIRSLVMEEISRQFGSPRPARPEEGTSSSPKKNTVNDTLSYLSRTPFGDFEEVKKFLDSFQRTVIRSRVSTILAGKEEATKMDFCWHNDEPIFVNLRVNVPLETSPNYVIQIISGSKDEELNISEFELRKRYAYVYDTNKYHRPLCKKLDNVDRINMICGVSPWFDFDRESRSWISNEFYGEMHPFDMLKHGHISSLIRSN